MSRFRVADLGPGLLLAAAGIGVGDMVSSIIAGAEYGLVLVWALAAGVVIKYTIAEGAARWQLATDRTLVEGWREHLPAPLLIGFFIYFVVWSYMVASALVSASRSVLYADRGAGWQEAAAAEAARLAGELRAVAVVG
jgi:Mn2+/Fe2+ NRAMP family transporter